MGKYQDIIDWREGIEDIYQVHGPYTTLQAVEHEQAISKFYVALVQASLEFRDNQFTNAIESLDFDANQLVEIPSFHRDYFYIKAAALASKNLIGEAYEVAKIGITYYPDYLNLLSVLMLCEEKLEIKPYAEHYKEVLDIYGEKLDLMIPYAKYLYINDRDDEAKAIAQRILDLDPNNVMALDIVGTIAFDNEEDELALECYSKSAELWPYNIIRLSILCDITLVMGDDENIEKAFTYSLNYFPKDYELNKKYANYVLYKYTTDLDKVIRIHYKLLENTSEHVEVKLALANALILNKEGQKAKDLLETCLQQELFHEIIYSLIEKAKQLL